MHTFSLLSSMSLLLSVAMLIIYGKKVIWRWFEGRSAHDANRYEKWMEELFIEWLPAKSLHTAYLVNGGIIAVTLIVLLFTSSFIFAALAAVIACYLPGFFYQVAREKRRDRFND